MASDSSVEECRKAKRAALRRHKICYANERKHQSIESSPPLLSPLAPILSEIIESALPSKTDIRRPKRRVR